jgi:beta-1,4-N-acetylglucosaminyltransferase
MKILITVGTTKFEELIKAVDNSEFYEMLSDNGFKELIYQKGTGEYIPNEYSNNSKLKVSVNSLLPDFEEVIKSCEYVISHGGAGIILESLKHKKTLFVAVNDTLMDNHQRELAESLAEDNYLYYIKDLRKITTEIESVVRNKCIALKTYPEFNEDIISEVIYKMLDI